MGVFIIKSMVMDMSDVPFDQIQSLKAGNIKNTEMQFPVIENPEYSDEQNQEIRLGKEEGLDVSIYS